MANVSINFNGKEFLLSCDDGQEEHLEELSNKLNNKFNQLKNTLGNIGENKLLLITAIKIIDEYYETKKNIDIKKNELAELINKFKELKSLVYDYKNEKESNIEQLNKSLEELNIQIEENNNNYNTLLDNTTNQIENFLKKSSQL